MTRSVSSRTQSCRRWTWPASFVALALATACSGCSESSADLAPVDPLRADPRVAELIYDCARDEPYLRDTSDMLPVLIEKLASGHKEPLRRAKEELMTGGEREVRALEGFVQRHFTAPSGFAYLQNALEVLGALESEAASRLLLQCLDHPTAEVRNRALRGLARRPLDPSAYDRLLPHLELEAVEVRPLIAKAMHHADAARAERQFATWIAEKAHEGLWRHIAPLIGTSEEPEVARLAVSMMDSAPLSIRASLALAAARGGNARALEVLAEMAEHPIPQTRLSALASYSALDRVDRLAAFLRDDPDESVRLAAVKQLERLGAIELIATGLNDASAGIRAECQRVLMPTGDRAPRDRALVDLGSPSSEVMKYAVDVLRESMRTDPELAEAAADRLLARFERERGRAFSARKATLQVLGQIPSERTAGFLLDLADDLEQELGGAEIEGLAVHRWCAIQAANSGLPGQAHLIGRLTVERDPVRRIDLLWAIGAQRNAASREVFLERVHDTAAPAGEVLFAASMLTKLGPASVVAPLLKQATLRVADHEVRRALQCLLWRWY